jgi:M6 family metalloprotease-like protein
MKNVKIFVILSVIFPFNLFGAYLENVPTTITQPNGIQIECFATGDEYYSWAHDKDGYTIIQDENTGYYCYAILSGDELTASQYVVGTIDPKLTNLTAHINISEEKILEKMNRFLQNRVQSTYANNSGTQSRGVTGTVNNIVIYIRFADQPQFSAMQGSNYSSMFNSTVSGEVSMRNYFREVSYNKLDVITHFYPRNISAMTTLSYQDSHNRDYYCPESPTNPLGYTNEGEGLMREGQLLANAINYVESQIPASLNIDYNNDGKVDNICFIVRGEASSPTLSSPIYRVLSAHRYWLEMQNVSIRGKRVYDYNLLLENSSLGVACHEINHTFGAPDLYQKKGGVPVGIWDLMGSQQETPQHVGAYMKYRYGGWISSIPSITSSGTYTLKSLTSATDNCYEIPLNGSFSESLVVEYRQKTGVFESSLPGSGLIIYRINKNYDGEGNLNATGDLGALGEVYVFRPAPSNDIISPSLNIRNAYFSAVSGRTAFGNSTNPECVLSDGGNGNIYIYNIRENTNNTLSFDISFCNYYSPKAEYISSTMNSKAVPFSPCIFTDKVTYYGTDMIPSFYGIREAEWVPLSPVEAIPLEDRMGGSLGNNHFNQEIKVTNSTLGNLAHIKLRLRSECGWSGYTIIEYRRDVRACRPTIRLSYSPNPTTDKLTVNFEELPTEENQVETYSVKLLDVSGGVLRQAQFNHDYQDDKPQPVKFNLSSLRKGMYYLHVEGGGELVREQIVIAK